MDIASARRMLSSHGQSHLVRFYDELAPPQQCLLLQQIATIDFDRLDDLIARYVLQEAEGVVPADLQPAPILSDRPADEAQAAEYAEARRRGQELLAEGKVAAFVVAGGQGTRLGYEGPKGCLEATPVAHKPLFRVFAEQILAASRRAGRPIPWYVMTSPANDVATRAFFRRREYFGLPKGDVFFLVQGTMPAIGLDGKVLLAEKEQLALSPDGHGGSLSALRASGALDDMQRRAVELISYFQVDNPLVRCVDPLFLGLHALRGAEMSAKALPKRDPMEKLGNFCLVGGKVRVIEYSDMPDELAEQTLPDGRLRFSAGSIAIHVLSRSFVERLTAGGRCELPFHQALKAMPHVDASGRPVRPDRPNAVKLETFVFDALPLAERTVILAIRRDQEFSPIKNAEGEDSLYTSLRDQVARASDWLAQAGVAVPRDADGKVAAAIEISPLFADSAAELKRRIAGDLKILPGQSFYLGERGQMGGPR